MVGVKDHDFSAARSPNVVRNLIDKNVVAIVNAAGRKDLAAVNVLTKLKVADHVPMDLVRYPRNIENDLTCANIKSDIVGGNNATGLCTDANESLPEKGQLDDIQGKPV